MVFGVQSEKNESEIWRSFHQIRRTIPYQTTLQDTTYVSMPGGLLTTWTPPPPRRKRARRAETSEESGSDRTPPRRDNRRRRAGTPPPGSPVTSSEEEGSPGSKSPLLPGYSSRKDGSDDDGRDHDVYGLDDDEEEADLSATGVSQDLDKHEAWRQHQTRQSQRQTSKPTNLSPDLWGTHSMPNTTKRRGLAHPPVAMSSLPGSSDDERGDVSPSNADGKRAKKKRRKDASVNNVTRHQPTTRGVRSTPHRAGPPQM